MMKTGGQGSQSIFLKDNNLFKVDEYKVKQVKSYKRLRLVSKTISYNLEQTAQRQNVTNFKQSQILESSKQKKKLKKEVLKNCFSSIVQSYQNILGTLSLVFEQLMKLNTNQNNATYAQIIHNQTVRKGLLAIQEVKKHPLRLSERYEQLLIISQQIIGFMQTFKKQLGLGKSSVSLPSHESLFYSIHGKDKK